jgi:hypothetical protein
VLSQGSHTARRERFADETPHSRVVRWIHDQHGSEAALLPQDLGRQERAVLLEQRGASTVCRKAWIPQRVRDVFVAREQPLAGSFGAWDGNLKHRIVSTQHGV